MRRVIFATLLISLLKLSQPLLGQEKIVISSNNLKCNDTVLVFTPEGVEVDTPLLFLLHGWSGSYRDWSKKCDLQAISNKYKFRIVTPDGFYNSWYLNNIDSSKMQWRTFFDQELYPQIYKRYKNSPNKTFITGLSMGGHGSINIFIDDTTRFKAAGSMSGVLNLQDTRLKETQINQVLGDYHPNNTLYDSSSAINRLDTIKNCSKLLIISCGIDDSLLNSSTNFANKCSQEKINHMLILSPGGHTWSYWTYMIELHLHLFNLELNRF